MVQLYSPGGANVLSRKGTLAPPGRYNWTCASLGLPESTTQPESITQTANKIGSAIFAQLTAESPYTL